jgi:replicative DNA helicase
MSVARIEQILLRERESGFRADVVIIDYDDEIVPPKKQKERRFEFADIYRDLRQFASRYNIILWTAAQTQRGTEHMKILSGDHLAEDFSKIRKVTMALSLGQGDWNKDSIYLWVAAHRHDKQHMGCTIMTDKDRMLIYDRERTRKMMDKETNSDLGS